MSAPEQEPRWQLFQSDDGKTRFIRDTQTKFEMSVDTDDATSAGQRQIKRMCWSVVDALNLAKHMPNTCNPHQ